MFFYQSVRNISVFNSPRLTDISCFTAKPVKILLTINCKYVLISIGLIALLINFNLLLGGESCGGKS